MRPTAYIRIVKIRKWFPPHDPLAAKIARLCIIREDLFIEMQELYPNPSGETDEQSVKVRRMYFLRSLIRTLAELSGAIQVLLNYKPFKTLLRRQSEQTRKSLLEGARVIGRAHALAKDIRNDICGHVLEGAVQAALERMPSEYYDFLEVGRIGNLTHYKFAHEITAEILLKGVSEEERQTISSTKFATIADLVAIFALIEICLVIYAEDRGLRRG